MSKYVFLMMCACVGLLLFGCLSEKNATVKGVVLSKSEDNSQTYVHLAVDGATVELKANSNSRLFENIIVGKMCTIQTDSGGAIITVDCI